MKSPPIEKCTFDQGREAPHFSMDLSSDFDKKVGDFNKKGIGKHGIYWLKDSERLLVRTGGCILWKILTYYNC